MTHPKKYFLLHQMDKQQVARVAENLKQPWRKEVVLMLD